MLNKSLQPSQSQKSRKELSLLIADLVPRIIHGVHIDFLAGKTLTHSQFFLMVALQSRGPATMRELAEAMQVSMPTISGVVDRLVRGQYIKRTADAQDRRQIVIQLAPKGEAVVAKFQEAVSQRWQQVLTSLDVEEVKTLTGLVTKILSSLKEKSL